MTEPTKNNAPIEPQQATPSTEPGQPTPPAEPPQPARLTVPKPGSAAAEATKSDAPPPKKSTPRAPAQQSEAKKEAKEESRITREIEDQIRELLRLMGQVINNAAIYGKAHKITRGSMTKCADYLLPLLEKCPRINLSVADGELLLEGKEAGMKNPFINILAAKLAELEILGFSLLQGMARDEFERLLELIVTPSALIGEGDGFAKALAAQGLQHVHPEKVTYQRVAEGQAVVGQETADKGEQVRQMGVSVEQIMAFLKGDPSVTRQQVSGEITAIASDAEKLAGLIMDSAAVRQRTASVEEGETLSDIVIGCLRRTFDGLTSGPAGSSQKGKKSIKKTMLLLEKTILDKLHATTGEPDPAADAAVSAAVAGMVDELEIDALADEYIKKRQALEKSEHRLIRCMKAWADDEPKENALEEKLISGGLPEVGWHELVVKSGVTAARAGGPQIPGGVEALAVLLAELDQLMAAAAAEPKAVGAKVAEAGQEVRKLAVGTEQKIDALADRMRKDEQALVGVEEAQRAKLKMSRRELMALLAEIVQELAQSLSAINCAIGMTLAGHIGDINSEQAEVLGVASSCGQRLDQLLDRLIEVVGLPKGLEPDKEMVYSSRPTPAD